MSVKEPPGLNNAFLLEAKSSGALFDSNAPNHPPRSIYDCESIQENAFIMKDLICCCEGLDADVMPSSVIQMFLLKRW